MHKLVVANYKMNGNIKFFRSLNILNKLKLRDTKIVLCPPFLYLPIVKLKNKSISLGCQNISQSINNKSTGEISPLMLKEFNVRYAIIGHSERRAIGETDDMVANKVINALNHDITPIICVGENNKEEGLSLVKTQVKAVLKAIDKSGIEKTKEVIFAYEPVWSIGTGKLPTIKDIDKAVKLIKTTAKSLENVKVLYGGSVSGDNFIDLTNSIADGFLLGGVSQKLEEFKKIVKGVDAWKKVFYWY